MNDSAKTHDTFVAQVMIKKKTSFTDKTKVSKTRCIANLFNQQSRVIGRHGELVESDFFIGLGELSFRFV